MTETSKHSAHRLRIPNLRKLFLADRDHLICDVDLDRADAVVVAWEAGAEGLKSIFRQHYDLVMAGKPGIDVHQANADAIGCTRHQAKAGVHATNYGVRPKRLANVLGVSVNDADDFQKQWFSTHPEILSWHRRIQAQLAHNRTVTNAFGFKAQFFSRPDDAFTAALAWIPQSTVSIVINTAWQRLALMPEVEVLLQVHDSLVFQYHRRHDPAIRPRIRDKFLVTIPYPDPCIIPVGLKLSTLSWGDCKEANWHGK